MSNEDGKKKKIAIPRHIYNQLIKFAYDREFVKFLDSQRKKLAKKGKKLSFKDIVNCRKEIKLFLRRKTLPLSWLEPIYRLIKDNELDIPQDIGITLKVGDDEITRGAKEFLLIKNKDGQIISHDSLSIVVTAKVSIERIIQFIKDHKGEIKHLQKVIELPKYKRLNWKDINLATNIIKMKDENSMTFEEIATKLSDPDKLSTKEVNYYSDANNIKSIYYRYKKYLKPST